MWRAFRRSEKDRCSGTRDALSGYMDGRLNPEEAARVEEHLNTCRGCREEMESLRAAVALLHRLPEVTPSKSFAVAPVRPLPGRRALPALRFAAAGVVLLLVVAFAADWTELFEGGMLSNPKAGPAVYDFNADTGSAEVGESYWVVSGVKNGLSDNSVAPVELVVPDHSDNVQVAVDSLETDGVVYATSSVTQAGPEITLTRVDEATGSGENVKEFTILAASSESEDRFSTNDAATYYSWKGIMKEQDGPYLNMLSSDNNVLYSFDLEDAKREVVAAQETDWLRPLEYGLIGLVAVLGVATAALWLRQRRARATEVSENKN